MPNSQLKALEQKIDELIGLCAALNSENAALKADASSCRQEHQHLVAKSELAKTNVKAIIGRLKALEQGS